MSKIIGVDLGGTHIRAGAVEKGKVFNYLKYDTPSTKKETLNVLVEVISKVLEEFPDSKQIGIASPGPLKDGFIENPPNITLNNFNLGKFIEKKFKRRVIIENDAKCVALSEIKYGTKKRNFVIITLGTGIGGGIVIDRKLYKGRGNAGEIGHMIIDDGKDIEYFWKKWILEMKKKYGKDFLIEDLTNSRHAEDKKALEKIYFYLGKFIGSIVSAFDPEEVVLMGGVREGGEEIVKGISKEAKKSTIIKNFPNIRWSKIKHPGVLGAGMLFD